VPGKIKKQQRRADLPIHNIFVAYGVIVIPLYRFVKQNFRINRYNLENFFVILRSLRKFLGKH
ncbi:MAG: hypothetical protein IJV46_05535, partial [Acidaminococcaceae bacterium]|nr:hypothetical protein [Acidaminococcaceae bacterium]